MSETSTSDSLIALQQLKSSISEQIIGQDVLVERMLIALLADGHILVEGAPGLAKTRAINALSNSIQADFHRVQFTPDLLPADLTGTEIYRPQQGSFEFQKGPLFHNLVLADEINRSPAKVQAALLEAMAERQITVGSTTYPLPPLFLVMATQNPIEQEGTYPLPEAQLDRFLLHVKIDYPQAEHEKLILHLARREALQSSAKEKPATVSISQESLFAARKEVLNTYMADNLEDYLLQIILATRNPGAYGEDLANWSQYGASPRASIALDRCARAKAWLNGKDFVAPEDIQDMAFDVLRHRVILSYEAEAEGITSDDFIQQLISRIAVP
ncbi:MoxR-like ATPase [Bathymodiolus platifrons methanotrophic gill symbiont]|uniref:AAA family ATPase n=1 Tax=Bathymodiolus platifrons methanotrophic gill symbiont TaxID=113268 RepID=UPI000B420A3E|nr:MoxR family ATPase [Bathymodiolus platifrons methanotrophic gill symbiont]MCK5870288.1 MoxR family ATPase [Methyloprofundus sp.]TXK94769.1 AAA family ATPase [Methylococcaceae bacterium CS5]TXK95104.1 AAA family ATPase [Methylococcaceae bacterium CS4]TXL03971.1 AAA family ATPase [Methylococcaceae bacterium CS1]TXL04440.1 AAA family ATPase [Methylococcaceae bacterium CS3]TXL09450.1 AAA family ATPase [Methylococcaceae bacterium CS2]TXL13524.1 AAA family ATPase [Methylococcaceae bacterium HT4